MSDNKKQSFFARKNIIFSPKLYFVDCMSSLALGLFSTLLISTIFSTIGKYAVEVSFLNNIGIFLNDAHKSLKLFQLRNEIQVKEKEIHL